MTIKDTLRGLFAALLALGCVYAFVAFCVWELNVARWSFEARFALATIGGVVAFFAGLLALAYED